MKKGLVLEGGAMRGMFTCGVIDVFMENGITFDGAIGVSAGAVFSGCNLKSRQIGRAIRYNKRFAKDPRYCSIWSLLFTGDLYGEHFCYRRLPDELDPFDREAFSNNPMEFYVVATNVNTGRAMCHRCTDGGREDMDWMQASASMPVASRPVKVKLHRKDESGKETVFEVPALDGGISNSVPLKAFEKMGYEKNVVILTQPDSYRKGPMSHAALMNVLLHNYPNILKRLRRRDRDYNRQIDYVREEEAKGLAYVIRPEEPLNIGSTCHDPDELERVYQLGRAAGRDALTDVRAFLGIQP